MTTEYKLASLRQKQDLPLEGKIILTQQRIREWYDHWQGQVCVAFSGGKDSTVLKHLVETTSGVYDVPSVFVNTGLEFPEIRMFAQSQPNVVTVMPEMRFDKVIEKYGYPVPTKNIAHLIDAHQRDLPWAKRFIEGEGVKADGTPSRHNLAKRWSMLPDAPFRISDKCCSIMKKAPVRQYQKETGRKPYIGTMASESQRRLTAYLKNGCNAYKSTDPKSQPMSFWTDQDVLEYILKYDLDYCSVYGEIKRDENGKLYTTGCDRTGCMFCMFGCHLEKAPNRFQRMKETHPRQYAYCMKSKDEGGLGLADVLDYIGVPYE
jgi:3'-phosphoadenosine 5'-phosphosulfate sulfotransferase (PAPS reductase)/FAD synthetase